MNFHFIISDDKAFYVELLIHGFLSEVIKWPFKNEYQVLYEYCWKKTQIFQKIYMCIYVYLFVHVYKVCFLLKSAWVMSAWSWI